MAKRKRYARARSGFRRAGGFLSGGTAKKVMAGVGSAKVGEMVGAQVGVNPMIPAALLGYFVAGSTGLITAVATEVISGHGFSLGSLGTQQQSTPAGTVYN